MKKGYNTPLLNHLLFGKPRDLFGGQLKVSLFENLTFLSLLDTVISLVWNEANWKIAL